MQSPEKRAVNLPQKFKVTISETLKLSVEVDAGSRDVAEQIVSDCWRKGEYILDASDFVGVEFAAVPVTEEAGQAAGKKENPNSVTKAVKVNCTREYNDEKIES